MITTTEIQIVKGNLRIIFSFRFKHKRYLKGTFWDISEEPLKIPYDKHNLIVEYIPIGKIYWNEYYCGDTLVP